MTEVSILWALNEIKQVNEPFELVFIKASTGEKVRRNFINSSKMPKSSNSASNRNRSMPNLKENYLLLLTDIDTNTVKHVKISLIICYNGYKVKH